MDECTNSELAKAKWFIHEAPSRPVFFMALLLLKKAAQSSKNTDLRETYPCIACLIPAFCLLFSPKVL
jgi:hypothetical protein